MKRRISILTFSAVVAACGSGPGNTDDAGVDAEIVGDACAGASDGTACGEGSICVQETCVESTCGDGFVDPALAEECDDGNETAFDGCEPTCSYTCDDVADCDDGTACNGEETCGASHVCVPGENLEDATPCALEGGGDGVCRAGQCVVAGCGNGVIEGTESCDDMNDVMRDGCEGDCRYTCEVDPEMPNTWFLDCDSDTYASAVAAPERTCARPAPPSCGGTWTLRAPVTGSVDCDDLRNDVLPGGTEVCDRADNDCDTTIDEDTLAAWYVDCDDDDYAAASAISITSCTEPAPTACGGAWTTRAPVSASATDCDDTRASASPGGSELCDGVDNDCNSQIDDGIGAVGGACDTGMAGVCRAGTLRCMGSEPLTCVRTTAPSTEACNNLDDNCDGSVDNGVPGTGGSCDGTDADDCFEGTRVCSGSSIVCSDTSGDSGTGARQCGSDLDCDNNAYENVTCSPGTHPCSTAMCGEAGTRVCGSSCDWSAVCQPNLRTSGNIPGAWGAHNCGFQFENQWCYQGTAPCTTVYGTYHNWLEAGQRYRIRARMSNYSGTGDAHIVVSLVNPATGGTPIGSGFFVVRPNQDQVFETGDIRPNTCGDVEVYISVGSTTGQVIFCVEYFELYWVGP